MKVRFEGIIGSTSAKVGCWVAVGLLGWAAFSHGAGVVRLDSSGFLRNATDRGNFSSTVVLGPQMRGDGTWVNSRLDGQLISYLSDRSSMTIEATNAYVSTGPRISKENEFTLGRRLFDWSALDTEWNLGLWSPRFIWDPFRPEPVGLTGAFYKYENSRFRAIAYGSPIAVPERGYPVREDTSGRLVSSSPFWTPQPSQLILMDKSLDIRYRINQPNYREALMRPNAGASLKYRDDSGMWGTLNYGYMPMHQMQLGIEPILNLSRLGMDVQLNPRFMRHHLVTAETGFAQDGGAVWASLTREIPEQQSAPKNWIVRPVGPSWIASTGGNLKVQKRVRVSASVLSVWEKPEGSTDNRFDIQIPSRYQYQRAYQLGSVWTPSQPYELSGKVVGDILESSRIVSLDTVIKGKLERTTGWSFGIGADFIQSTTGQGSIGQYVGSDRLRGRLSYVF